MIAQDRTNEERSLAPRKDLNTMTNLRKASIFFIYIIE
jgi:hypothetical protein